MTMAQLSHQKCKVEDIDMDYLNIIRKNQILNLKIFETYEFFVKNYKIKR